MTIADRYAHLSPLKRALLALDETKARLDAAERGRTEPIAIVGLGCRIPGAPNPAAFWALLREGRSAVRDVPADRWDVDAYFDPDPAAPGKMSTRSGAFLDRIDLFDPQFFGISPREAESMDPQQRLFLEVVWEALEHGGIAPDSLSGTATGVFAGVAAGDYADLMKAHGDTHFDGHFASGIAHSVLSGRVSYILGLQGPSVSVDTACSSSLVAVHLACQSLRTGDCRMAIAGGVNLIITPDNSVLFSKTGMLAPDGRCKTFDAAADGFVRGEGCGVIVIKRLSDAVADGDRVIALIRGSAANQDGPSSSLTAPNGPAQEAVMREALERSGLQPADIDFVEAHGTGTPLGDPIEVQALGAVHAGRPRERPLLIGSLKTNTGHLEAAAGIAGLIKLVLSLQHEALPAHLHLTRPNPHVAWEDLPLRIATSLTPWTRGERPRIGGVSSFGFSGTNAHVVVEEAPAAVRVADAPDRPLHLVALSARSEAALVTRASDLLDAVRADAPRLADVAFTENVGRARLPVRAALVAGSLDALEAQLQSVADGGAAPGVQTGRVSGSDRPRVAFLFTGQGAQHAGMGRTLFDTEPTFRQAVERCDEILKPDVGRSILSVLFPAPGDEGLIDETAYTQPALFVIDYALAVLWKSWGVTPNVVMGHSLGEYVAACVAGVLSLEDALALVAIRGRLMQQLPRDGAMASVFAPAERVSEALRPYAANVSIAAINDPAQTVVSGDRGALEALLAALAGQGVKSKRLAVSHAFHSPLMAPMLDEFRAVLERVSFSPPRVSLVSNVTGRVATADEVCRPEYWTRHIMAPVRFAESVATLGQMGVTAFVEAGPTPTLLAIASRCLEGDHLAWLPSLRKGHDDWSSLLDTMARLFVRGVPIDWQGFDRHRSRRRLALPTYPFERERHWIAEAPLARRPMGVESLAPVHPLLQHPLRVAHSTSLVFDTTVSLDTLRWVFDHRVHGAVIVPGAGFVEIGFAAARARWGDGTHGVEDLFIHRAATIDESRPTTLQVVVRDVADGRAAFQVFTVPADPQSADWPMHAEGTIVRADGVPAGEPVAPTLAESTARWVSEVLPDALYGALRGRGLELGPAFQGIREARRGPDGAWARVELPPAAGAASGYCVHPVLLDMAIQTLGAALVEPGAESGASFLPVAVGRARRFSGGPVRFTQAVPHTGSLTSDTMTAGVFLRDGSGGLVASLEGLRLQRVDRAVLARSQAATTRGWLYDVEWRPLPVGATLDALLPPLTTIAARMTERVGPIAEEHRLALFEEGLPQLEALSAAYAAEALASLGVTFQPGECIRPSTFIDRAGVIPAQQRLLGRLFEMLGDVGLLRSEGDTWVVVRSREPENTLDWLATLERHYGVPLQAEIALTARCGPRLAEVLTGRADPLALLFPGGSSQLAENLYQVSPAARTFNQLLAESLEQVVASVPAGRPLRIIEIGGGTGSTSSFILPRLRPDATEYVFTDVSPVFTTRAAQKFAAYPFVRYQPLDIERDPAAQGLDGATFDVVVAANVLHATRDLGETFAHVRQLLAPGGLLVMLEMVRPQRWIDLTFGLTDGWWRFTDAARRPSYPLLGHAGWSAFLQEIGFRDVVAVPGREDDGVLGIESAILALGPKADVQSATGKAWLVLGDSAGAARALVEQLERRGGRCTMASVGDDEAIAAFLGRTDPGRAVVHLASLELPDGETATADQLRACEAEACGSALRLLQRLAASGGSPVAVTLVTRGAQSVIPGEGARPLQAPLWGLGKVAALEHPELLCLRVDLDPGTDSLDLLADALVAGSLAAEDQIAFRGGGRYVPRLVPHGAMADRSGAAAIPEICRLEVARRGAFDGLALVPAVRCAPKSGEVEVRVHAAALNFRDVMNVLGLYPGDPGPLGNECTGTVSAVGAGVSHLRLGDEVVGLAGGSFATYVTAPAAFLVPRPSTLDADEAVTVPIAYVTAYFALHHLAGLRAGDRVLIHAAAGGVGLAAVHLARRAGAQVFATAGSAEKRAYLASLGVTKVMSSRSLEFADEIRAHTGGRGVDVVLNSLSGDFIARSFDIMAEGGRFLEIGKGGWNHDQVDAIGKGLRYHVIDWGVDAQAHPELIRSMLTDVLDLVAKGELPALPSTAFSIALAGDAFRFMAQARHTGKVLITLPDPTGSSDAPVRPDGTYLVTGGLSGLGLLTASWLVDAGARHLVLMGRREPSDAARDTLRALEHRGVSVSIVRGDVSHEADVATALARAGGERPPLRGVIHSAGVLDDGALVQQTWSRFETVMAPKVVGAWHLDRLTREQPLDFFVLYSSVASTFGSRGQANHSAANAYLDALSHARRAAGRPALSINWGVWSEVGAAVRHGVDKRVSGQGVGTIDPSRGLMVLEQLMREEATHVTVFPVDWVRYAEQAGSGPVPRFLSAVMSEAAPRNRQEVDRQTKADSVGVPVLRRLVDETPQDGRMRVVLTHVRECAVRVLALPPSRPVDPRQPLSELGLDSLMAVELRNVLGTSMGETLPATLLFDYPTVETLASYLYAKVTGTTVAVADVGPPMSAGGGQVVDRIDELSDEEVDRLLADRVAGKKKA
jgi:acyl transferase domain-containing protein/acyl carrier protein